MQINVNELNATPKKMHFQFVILHAGKERENTVGSGNKQQS